MTYFLFGIVFGWLIGLTCFHFRKEIPRVDTWTYDAPSPVPRVTSTVTRETAEFIDPDRVGEIIKGKKEEVRLDDILV